MAAVQLLMAIAMLRAIFSELVPQPPDGVAVPDMIL
jgi:hypothetical protein